MTLLGADDLLLPNFVSTVLRLHRRWPEAAVIQPGVTVIGADGSARSTLVDAVKNRVRPWAAEAALLTGSTLARSLLTGNWL